MPDDLVLLNRKLKSRFDEFSFCDLSYAQGPGGRILQTNCHNASRCSGLQATAEILLPSLGHCNRPETLPGGIVQMGCALQGRALLGKEGE